MVPWVQAEATTVELVGGFQSLWVSEAADSLFTAHAFCRTCVIW